MFKNHQGTILLLALLILTGILVTASIIATIVLQQMRMSRNIDQAIFAFYAAEAGAERGLYLLRQGAGSFSDVMVPGTLGNGARFDANNSETKASETMISNLGIEKNQSFQIDLYDPDNFVAGSGISSIVITESGGGSGWAEVSWISWDPGGAWNVPGAWSIGGRGQAARATTQLLSPSSLDSGAVVDFGNTLARRVRIKALYENLADVTITAHSGAGGGGSQVDIPGRIVIKSVGEYQNSNQALKVAFPRESPLYGLYDYVIFSEESLVK